MPNKIFAGLHSPNIHYYIDDVLVFNTNIDGHLITPETIFQLLWQSGLKLKLEKYKIAQREIR